MASDLLLPAPIIISGHLISLVEISTIDTIYQLIVVSAATVPLLSKRTERVGRSNAT
jgi:hypothetical protein